MSGIVSRMSATGRNREGHERDPSDFYATPSWCTWAMWRRLGEQRIIPKKKGESPFEGLAGRPGLIFVDAGAGEGAIAKALVGCKVPSQQIALVENDAKKVNAWTGDSARWAWTRCADYLAMKLDSVREPHARCHVTIMNPPYSQAREFVEHSIKESIRTIALLRLGFLESKARYAFLRANPCDVYVLSKRPSFAHGKTDNSGYAWFDWPGTGRLEVLDLSKMGLKGYGE